MNPYRIVLTAVLLAMCSATSGAQAPGDTVNGWFFVGASGGGVDTTYSALSDTAFEGRRSQQFYISTFDQHSHTAYFWGKQLDESCLVPNALTFRFWLLNTLTGTSRSELYIGIWVASDADTVWRELCEGVMGRNSELFLGVWQYIAKQVDFDKYDTDGTLRSFRFNRILVGLSFRGATLSPARQISAGLFEKFEMIYDRNWNPMFFGQVPEQDPSFDWPDSTATLDRFGDKNPRFSLSRTDTVFFGSVWDDTIRTETLFVKNAGEDTLTIRKVERINIVGNPVVRDFRIEPSGSTLIAPGDSVRFSFIFDPYAPSVPRFYPNREDYVFYHNGFGQFVSAPLVGKGLTKTNYLAWDNDTDPENAEMRETDFGRVPVGGSAEDDMYIQNMGTEGARLVSLLVSDTVHFHVTPDTASFGPFIWPTPPPWSKFIFSFVPTDTLSVAGTVSFVIMSGIPGDARFDTLSFPVFGKGSAAAMKVNVSEIQFGNVPSLHRKTDSVIVTNVGSLPLSVSVECKESWFSISWSDTILLPQEHATIRIEFVQDTSRAQKVGYLILSHNGPGSPDSVKLVADWTTGVDDGTPHMLPSSFALHQNYPNPFNPSTTVRYDLPRISEVRLAVYDMLGKEVWTRDEGTQNAGSYTVPFDGSKLSSGIYLFRITAGSWATLMKMVLLK